MEGGLWTLGLWGMGGGPESLLGAGLCGTSALAAHSRPACDHDDPPIYMQREDFAGADAVHDCIGDVSSERFSLADLAALSAAKAQ